MDAFTMDNARKTMHSPLELAIEVVETRMSDSDDIVLYQEHVNRAKALSPYQNIPIEVYVDHTLSLLVNAGYLKRHHIELGVLGYTATPNWSSRDRLLEPLRAPKRQNRSYRSREAEARRAARKAVREAAREQRERTRKIAREAQKEANRKARYERRVAMYGLTEHGNIRRRSSAIAQMRLSN